MSSIKSVSIIGSGNVATHLGENLYTKGISIDVIFNHKLENAKKLATRLKCDCTDEPLKIPANSDLYIVALKDNFIQSTLSKINFTTQFVVHTSGSFDSSKLNQFTSKWGCFYPMQTFKKKQAVNLQGTSIFIESNHEQELNQLHNLCSTIDCNGYVLSSKQRKQLHIAAIATNNFTYHLFSHIQQYCDTHQLPYDSLQPLLLETLKKIELNEPFKHQTGPAARNEKQTIKNHLELLANENYLAEIYGLFSKQILDKQHEL